MATIILNWTPTSETTISYEVRYAINSATPSYLSFPTAITSATITGLLDGEKYVVGVRSICEGNIYSDWSQKIILTCDNVYSCFMEGYATFNSYV